MNFLSVGMDFMDIAQTSDHVGKCRIWVHLEGLRLLNNESDDPDNITAVMALLTRAQGKRMDVEQQIVNWLCGLGDEAEAGSDAKAQLYAVADGILEGRHR